MTDRDQQNISRLLRKVEHRFGDAVSANPAINRLQTAIQEATGEYLSNSSLRRLFGLVKYDKTPNLHTLNTLAQYAGYESYQSFCDWLMHKEGLRLTIADYETAWRSFQALGHMMRTDTALRATLYPQLAKTDGYWHNWMEMDYLCVHHHEGLQLYLKHNDSVDARCMGHGWLALAGTLNPEVTNWTYHALCLDELATSWLDEKSYGEIHPFLAGRVLAAVWAYHHDVKKTKSDALWAFIVEQAKQPGNFGDQWDTHPCLAQGVTELLLARLDWDRLAGFLATVLSVFEIGTSPIHEGSAFKQLPWLYHAVALAEMGDIAAARALMQELKQPTADFPPPHWDHNRWIRYWFLRLDERLNEQPDAHHAGSPDNGSRLSETIAAQQAWTALCRQSVSL